MMGRTQIMGTPHKIKGTMKIHRLEGFNDRNQARSMRYPPLRGASNHAHHDITSKDIIDYCFPLLHPLIKVLQIRLPQFVYILTFENN